MERLESLVLDCPAKVNLTLGVGPPDAAGMHPIASWMAALAFGDELTLQKVPPEQAGLHIAFAADTPRPSQVDWPIEQDLAHRAWRGVEQAIGEALPTKLSLSKRVPPGTGLGGGSADAAATLLGLNRLWQLELRDDQLLSLASELGSDVVFATGALLGHAHCLVSGTGEVLDPLPPRPPLWLVLIFPDVTCPTGPVYRAFDALNHSEHPPVGPDLQRCRHAANAALTANAANAANAALTHPEALFNDLTEPAFTVRPALRKAHTNAQVAANQPIHMSGSGSALFTLASNEPAAHALAGRIRQQTNLPTRVTCSR